MSLHAPAPFPVARPRRLRQSAALRALVAETHLSARQLVLPLFVRAGRRLRREVTAMPGVFQLSPDELVKEAGRALAAGVGAVLLFGIPERKDAKASGAYARQGIVQQAVRRLKKELPSLLVITDVCLCEYMEHGHCGIVQRGARGARILNDPTLKLLARTAASHAEAGADIVAPSDMMDGHTTAIRRALDESALSGTAIMAYAAKYASAFYGPFRVAAGSAPQFGDRRGYQMDPPNGREALREIEAEIEEGADIVMVKPALPYLDVLRQARDRFDHPLAAYNVSGEYAMVKAAARDGWVEGDRVMLEVLTSIKRAGAGIIITYHAKEAARLLA